MQFRIYTVSETWSSICALFRLPSKRKTSEGSTSSLMEPVTLTFILKEGDKVLTQSTTEVTKEFSLLDFLNKTIPGLEESVKAFLDKSESEFKLHFTAGA